MVQCSVCGADVHKDDEPVRAEHDGETYYFDSADCREQFEESPEAFV